jgi:heme/copper-type cytochrome/quinol oxidase subunit 1
MSLVEVHGRLAYTALLYISILAVWGWWRYLRKEGLNANYRGAVMIATLLVLVQAGLGVFLWLSGMGSLAGRSMHVLYGIVAVLLFPGAFVYTQGNQDRRAILIYALGFTFMIGILLRSITTG